MTGPASSAPPLATAAGDVPGTSRDATSPSAPARPPASAPAGRRRLAPSERVPLIREAAFAEFAERGYGAARMEAVARRAGIAKGLLYHHFPAGKAALFAAVVEGLVLPVLEDAERLAAGFEGPRAELLARLLAQAYAAIVADPRGRVVLRLMIAEGDRVPALADLYHDAVLARANALLSAVLRQGAERGEFRAEAAAWPPQVVMAPVILASTWRLLFAERHPLDLDALAAAHLDLLRGGLLA